MNNEEIYVDEIEVITVNCPGCLRIETLYSIDEVKENQFGSHQKIIDAILRNKSVHRRTYFPAMGGMIDSCQCPSKAGVASPAGSQASPIAQLIPALFGDL